MKVTLPYPPSANRYWRLARGRLIVSSEAKKYKEQVAEIGRKLKLRPISGDVVIFLDCYRPAKRGDLDNTLKVAIDSLRRFAYHDDKQITQITACRYDDKANPRMEVEVVPA